MPTEGKTYSKKICMLGTFGVGKTSLVRRFVRGVFDEKYLSTIGVHLSHKSVSPFEDSPVQFNFIIWDLAHIEKFSAATRNYFRGAAAAIIVVDLTREVSFSAEQIRIAEFKKINPGAELIFAGNKADLVTDLAEAEAGLNRFAAQWQGPALLTSAKTGENVQSLFTRLAAAMPEARTS